MFLPYKSNSCYESDYECICIVINGKTRSVPLNNLRSVYLLTDSLKFISMINHHRSMGLGRDRTRHPWICSQTRY